MLTSEVLVQFWSVFRLPRSSTSTVPAAVKEAGSVVTWDRSRTLRSRSSSAALQKTLMGTLAPSSRGVTKVHDDSEGYTVWCMVSQPSNFVASSFQFSALLGAPWVTFQRAVFPLFRCLFFWCRRRHRPLLPEVAECKRLVKPRLLCARALPFGLLSW